MASSDPIQLEIFKHLFAAVAEEMGVVLRKSSYSANIKERRDYSCAVFDAQGAMVAQAAHIPVHLGSMPLSVLAAAQAFPPPELYPGDMILLNDPYRGGTHLPDITLVAPVFPPGETAPSPLVGYVACRAHHADVGGMSPGSMPVAREIFQEGLIIPPIKIVQRGALSHDLLSLILANVRTPDERQGDLWAQIAANRRGLLRLQEMVQRYGLELIHQQMQALQTYTGRMTRRLLGSIPDGVYSFTDYLDSDGITDIPIPITTTITVKEDTARIDFTGSAPQQVGSVNAVLAITLSAVSYVFRCLLGVDAPHNSGCLEPLEVIAPAGSIVNALPPAPVAGGNVETSQRIVDVLLGALAQACPDRVPAASQGTMNNLTIGGRNPLNDLPFTYYETIGGGMGAHPGANGLSALHSHMTNTLNTPVEALEYTYPLRVTRYGIRRGSGGAGAFQGGDGICREFLLLADAQVTLISERRLFAPYGLQGGEPGKTGWNMLIRQGEARPLPGKGSFDLRAGDRLLICTPGGGGFGKAKKEV
jgi:N-methylhydantoinase B